MGNPISITITPAVLQVIKNGGFNGFPYGIQKVGSRYIIGSSPETLERIQLNDTMIFTQADPIATLKSNIYQLYIDSPSLFKTLNSTYSFSDMIEDSGILYAATNNGVGVSADSGNTWLFRKTMVDTNLIRIKQIGTQKWICSKRTIGYSTDNFSTVSYVPYFLTQDIVDIEIGTLNDNQVVIICTANGAYWSSLNTGVWSSWSQSPAPSTSQVASGQTSPGTGLPIEYTVYDNTKPYSNDFRSVLNIGSTFYFGTAQGLVYTTDFVTWNHFEQMPTNSVQTPTIPNSTYGRIRKIGNSNKAFAAIIDGGTTTGSVVSITDGSTPAFSYIGGFSENTFDVYSYDGLRSISVNTNGSQIRLSLDGFSTECQISNLSGLAGCFISPSTSNIFLLGNSLLSRSNDKNINVSTDSSLKQTTSNNSGTTVTVTENYNIFTLYDFTKAIINQDANFIKMTNIKGTVCGYIWLTSLDPAITANRNWYLYGIESSYTDIKNLAKDLGMSFA